MANLYKKTVDTLAKYGLSITDVEWVQDSDYDYQTKVSTTYEIPIADFIEWAKDTEVKDDYGENGEYISTSLMIVGKDWWLERRQDDDCCITWWEYKSMPSRPTEVKSIL